MSTENDSNLEEQYKNIVQSVENQEVSEPEPVQEAPLNLGKVNMERFTGERAEEIKLNNYRGSEDPYDPYDSPLSITPSQIVSGHRQKIERI